MEVGGKAQSPVPDPLKQRQNPEHCPVETNRQREIRLFSNCHDCTPGGSAERETPPPGASSLKSGWLCSTMTESSHVADGDDCLPPGHRPHPEALTDLAKVSTGDPDIWEGSLYSPWPTLRRWALCLQQDMLSAESSHLLLCLLPAAESTQK